MGTAQPPASGGNPLHHIGPQIPGLGIYPHHLATAGCLKWVCGSPPLLLTILQDAGQRSVVKVCSNAHTIEDEQ
ncbi:hypothetical protein GCM10008094_03020 [Aidingimonas halophila]|nr:hypothetical protein GCM10008094_03020 [Aidingimonas halophila]